MGRITGRIPMLLSTSTCPPTPSAKAERVGLLDRLKARLTRTRTALSDGVSGLFRGGRAIDAALLSDLEELLYTCDLGPVAADVTAELARLHKRGEIKGEDDVRAALRRILLEKVNQEAHEIDFSVKPTVILVVGVNGSGKTTSIAKLGERYRKMGKSVLLGAGDTFRAAAADQLEIWAQRNGAQIVRQKPGADPAAVAYDAVDAGIARGVDVVIVDTAGRLHTQANLMAELDKMRRVIERRLPGAPHETWLVLDATNGQNAIQQAKLFTAAVQVTGLIVAKLDGTARGGALFAIKQALGLPVRYVGTGEQLDLLETFEPEAFVDAIVGREP
jgi:fused signal recognition particle receptor